VATARVTQEFEIGALSSIWLPAAYRPVTVDGTDAGYDPESGSLIVPEELEVTQPGQRYTIESVLPQLTGDALADVPAVAPEDVVDAYTELPEGFSPLVRAEAATVTAGADTPYARALALQDHFRNGTFTYDLDVAEGHGGDALEEFLFTTRTGYCEQFAGAFAAMARSVGLPARVAVGFTPGEPGADGRFVVRGANGHAWPEVYLEGYGWVPFEPTPGRGIPGATAYTGVPEEQAAVTDPLTATTAPSLDAALPMVPPQGDPSGIPELGLEGLVAGEEPAPTPSPWPRRLALAGVVVVGLPVTWAVAVAAASQLRTWRRRIRAKTPEARLAVTWTEVIEALTAAGATPQPWERRWQRPARGPPASTPSSSATWPGR
jgi:transglutaminase-like putative cysteine protease